MKASRGDSKVRGNRTNTAAVALFLTGITVSAYSQAEEQPFPNCVAAVEGRGLTVWKCANNVTIESYGGRGTTRKSPWSPPTPAPIADSEPNQG